MRGARLSTPLRFTQDDGASVVSPRTATGPLHVGVAVAHLFVKCWFGDVERSLELCVVLPGKRSQRGSRRSIVVFEREPALLCQVCGHALQFFCGGVQILRVARVGDPDGLSVAEHTGEPVGLELQKYHARVVVRIREEELLLPAAVVARSDRNRLTVAALEQ